jgi:exodeoxyribonuclease VII large subunit
MKVMISGRVCVYEPRGEYQIDVMQIVPHGKGDLAAAFEQLKEKLQKEGLFDAKRKRPIPMLPKKIGIVTSRSGAAVRDMLQILNRRYANLCILLFPAIVQGEEAAPSIAEGIRVLNRYRDIDVLIVGRGGGSLEDLWPFNEEPVARAIAASRIPVISAVGHETDTTIADFVADLRAPTPSAAAELVIGKKSELVEKLHHMAQRVHAYIRNQLLHGKHAARALSEHRALAGIPQKVRTHQQQVDDYEIRLKAGLERFHQLHARRHLMAGQKLSSSQLRHLIEVKRSELNGFLSGLRRAADRLQRDRDRRVAAAGQKLNATPLRRLVEAHRNRMAAMETAIVGALQQRTSRDRQQLARFAGKLDSLSPLAVLERGYSIASREDGEILKTSAQAAPGDPINVRLHHGQLKCKVTEVKDE